MIKELINDLVFDKISLNQGLTRAKLIASKIADDDFKEWLRSEINGYSPDITVPEYRLIPCDLKGTIEDFSGLRVIPISVHEIDIKIGGKIYTIGINHDIDSLETTIKEAADEEIIFKMPHGLVKKLMEMTQTRLIDVGKVVQKTQLRYIVSQTKQRLIDTLIKLNETFPDFENEFVASSENKDKVHNIINNYIYGDNANTNIGIGDTVNQKIDSKNITKTLDELREIGLDDKLLEELKNLSSERKSGKGNILSKFTAWIAKMSQFVIEKGIEHPIPIIIEKASELIK